jgi:flagellar basal-body rod modification protein FlgD
MKGDVMAASVIGITGQQGQQGPNSNEALRGLDMDEFLKLMIAELQNQDPLNPMENSDILEQIGQMRQIDSSTRLSDTLDSVLLGQNLSNANTLIGRRVEGLSDEGESIAGVVERVTIEDKSVKLHVAGGTLSLTNVREVLP